MKVLVVDDDRLSRSMLRDALTAWGHEVVCAPGSREALKLLSVAPDVALVITDWVMPDMEGPELCRRIREMRTESYLPILLHTSQTESHHVTEALEAGADALVPKPLHPALLRAQIGVASRILDLEEGLRSQVVDLEDANDRIHRDLEAAAAIQKSHLPSHPPEIPSVGFAWIYSACRTLGGDMFNVFRLDERNVGLYILDVSGHGTSAALLSVSLSRTLVPSPQQGGILKRSRTTAPYYEVVSPEEVANELNRRFRLMEQSGRFCTFLYGVLDVHARRFRYVTAGHPGPIEVLAGVSKTHEHGSGVPIGVLPEADYAAQEIELSPGSQIFLYTDGVTEARNGAREAFGTERMLRVLSEGPTGLGPDGVHGMVQALCEQLVDFTRGERQRDDITLVGMGLA